MKSRKSFVPIGNRQNNRCQCRRLAAVTSRTVPYLPEFPYRKLRKPLQMGSEQLSTLHYQSTRRILFCVSLHVGGASWLPPSPSHLCPSMSDEARSRGKEHQTDGSWCKEDHLRCTFSCGGGKSSIPFCCAAWRTCLPQEAEMCLSECRDTLAAL